MPTDTFSITSASDDGSGYYQSASWPPNGGTWTDSPGDTLWVSKVKGSPDYFEDETFLRFDTSSLPDGATITGAVLQLHVVAKNKNENYSLVGDYYDFGGEPTVGGDWVLTASPSIFTAVDLNSLTASEVNNITLTDLSGISKTGYTGIRLTLDTGPGTPTASSDVQMASFENVGNQEPRLLVTYTAATTRLLPGKIRSRGGSW